MKKIQIALCDDHDYDRKLYAKRIIHLGNTHRHHLGVKCYVNGDDLLFDFERSQYFTSVDILLLNIHMPGMNGIEVARKVREIGYKNLIVFLSGSTNHYESAFDVKSFNFITKNKADNMERFDSVLLSAIDEVLKESFTSIVLSSGGIYEQIPLSDIQYFEVQKNNMIVYYSSGKTFRFLSSLSKIEEKLKNHGFFRVHKSFLISLRYVNKIYGYEVTMQDQSIIPIGRKYSTELRKKMERIADDFVVRLDA